MIKLDPYENPFYRGPECDGLTSDEAFDLARQYRLAAKSKRISAKLAEKRAERVRLVAGWGFTFAITVIILGLTLAALLVRRW